MSDDPLHDVIVVGDGATGAATAIAAHDADFALRSATCGGQPA